VDCAHARERGEKLGAHAPRVQRRLLRLCEGVARAVCDRVHVCGVLCGSAMAGCVPWPRALRRQDTCRHHQHACRHTPTRPRHTLTRRPSHTHHTSSAVSWYFVRNSSTIALRVSSVASWRDALSASASRPDALARAELSAPVCVCVWWWWGWDGGWVLGCGTCQRQRAARKHARTHSRARAAQRACGSMGVQRGARSVVECATQCARAAHAHTTKRLVAAVDAHPHNAQHKRAHTHTPHART
jgi:hypothetical protein